MTRGSRTLYLARVFLVLAFLALLGAWIAQFTGTLFGLSQPHLFSDATVLGVLALGLFADAFWHRSFDTERR